MSDKEKTEFTGAVRETFLSSIAQNLSTYSPENTNVTFYPTQYRGRDEALVRAMISRGDQQTRPDRLEFLMKRGDKNWQVIDIKANGTSARLFYRKHFIAELRDYSRKYNDRDRPDDYPDDYDRGYGRY